MLVKSAPVQTVNFKMPPLVGDVLVISEDARGGVVGRAVSASVGHSFFFFITLKPRVE